MSSRSLLIPTPLGEGAEVDYAQAPLLAVLAEPVRVHAQDKVRRCVADRALGHR